MAMTGTVKFFNGERGYGFIKPDDGGRDVFVHITAVERAGLKDLTEGQRITFEVEPDKKGKGPKAVNLVISSRAVVVSERDVSRLQQREESGIGRDALRSRMTSGIKKSRPRGGREVGSMFSCCYQK